MRALRNHAQSYAASGGASSISGVRLTYPGMWRIATFTGRNGYFAGGSITHGNKTDFYDARGLYQGSAIDKTFAHGQIGMLTPERSRRFSRPHCPRCKLRLSQRSPVVCPKDAEINCVCCDHCRRECALDARGSQLKRS
jgi:hypothetical protein